MSTYQIKVVATIVLAVFGIMLLRCLAFSDNAATCMRSNVIDAALWAAHWATLVAGVWLGVEAARVSERKWVGWVAGIAVTVALNVALSWMGFTLPSHEIDDGAENSYRR